MFVSPASPPQPASDRAASSPAASSPAAGAFWALAAILALAHCGCDTPKLDDDYGKRRGVLASKSVNGTSVLAAMFEARGWGASSWQRLSPKLKTADVIVWAPDSFTTPSDEQIDWFEDWMRCGFGRTLVFIGRDYDAAPEYWRRISGSAAAEDAAWIKEAGAQADYVARSDRRAMNNPSECRWYSFSPRSKVQVIQSLDEDSKWAAGVDAKKLSIKSQSTVVAPTPDDSRGVEVLLSSSAGELVAYRIVDENEQFSIVDGTTDSQVIVVANGSFLLNLPLVNNEHRKLAGMLIEECDTGGPGDVVFLEQTPLKLEIYDKEPVVGQKSGFTMLTIWPLGFLLVHLFVLGLFACLITFPIFGRAASLKEIGVADFGKHISAVGSLVAITKNRDYALERLKHYEEHVRRDRDS